MKIWGNIKQRKPKQFYSIFSLFLCIMFKVDNEIKGMKIGLVKEGFEGIDGDVVTIVREAASWFKSVGVDVEETSIPLHSDSKNILSTWKDANVEKR